MQDSLQGTGCSVLFNLWTVRGDGEVVHWENLPPECPLELHSCRLQEEDQEGADEVGDS